MFLEKSYIIICFSNNSILSCQEYNQIKGLVFIAFLKISVNFLKRKKIYNIRSISVFFKKKKEYRPKN